MKIAVLGASGWIGSHIVNEAKARGHEVIALVRNPDSFEAENVEARQFDLLDQNSDITAAVDGAEVVISAIGGRSAGNHDHRRENRRNAVDSVASIYCFSATLGRGRRLFGSCTGC